MPHVFLYFSKDFSQSQTVSNWVILKPKEIIGLEVGTRYYLASG